MVSFNETFVKRLDTSNDAKKIIVISYLFEFLMKVKEYCLLMEYLVAINHRDI